MEIITVKQLNAYIKSLIEGDALLYNVTVKGEISNFTNHYKSGHFYFSLKFEGALIRAVKSPQGEVSLDFTGKKPGRGAYVCPNSECLKRARKSRALERALDTAIPESVYEEMEKEMANGG